MPTPATNELIQPHQGWYKEPIPPPLHRSDPGTLDAHNSESICGGDWRTYSGFSVHVPKDIISTRKQVVEFWWDTQNTQSFVTKSTGSTWVGKEERDNVETVHTHLF